MFSLLAAIGSSQPLSRLSKMVTFYRILFCTYCLLLLVGCVYVPPKPFVNRMPESASAALDNAAGVELISLDPSHDSQIQDAYHGCKVLGSVIVSDPSIVHSLVDSLKLGVAEHDGAVAVCFNPRHAIKFTVDGKLYEFVICFECLQVIWSADSEPQEPFLVSGSPQAVFDRVLNSSGVELAPTAY